LSVLIVGPALIVAALGLLATMASSHLAKDISHIAVLGSVLAGMGRLMPYVLVTGVFAFMYAFVPNTQVRMKAALVGGLVAGCAWAAVGALFASFVAHSTQTIAIYASFAILIVTLIWVHLCWLILLLGAQLSFYVQNPQYLRPGRSEIHLTSSLRERIALSVMYLIAQRFQEGERRWTIEHLSEQFDVPSASVGSVVRALEAKGILLAADDDTWVPARNPDAIELFEVLDAVRNDATSLKLGHIRSTAPAEAIAREVETALRASVKGKTVRDLVTDK
jgi:membrane protein